MEKDSRFVGLDVHAETIAVGVAEPGGEVRSLGTIPNTPEAVRRLVRLVKKLGPPETLRVCYEAGPTGYVLYRQLSALGVPCAVIAPTLVPVKAGDRVKTDRRDAEKLARSYRSGDLTPVWVPDPGHEALRDLVRAREAAKKDQLRARHRLGKFLLRQGRRAPTGSKAWGVKHRAWLQTVIAGLQALRGIAKLSAVSIVTEVGALSRFAKPRQLMGYSGAVASEHSSGPHRRRGGITKTGNAHLRRIVIEAAWAYRHRPAIGGTLRTRQAGLSEEVKALAWKAQHRLHGRYARLLAKGKAPTQVVTAIARELLGFIWAIGVHIEQHTAGGAPAA